MEGSEDFESALHALNKRVITEHKRIIFNGNGYDDKWIAEAKARGLKNYATTPDALPHFVDEKNITLFTTHKVYTEREMRSRLEIQLKSYCNLIHIEGDTMVEMTKKEFLPCVSKYSQELANTIVTKRSVRSTLDVSYEAETLEKISTLTAEAFAQVKQLETALTQAVQTQTMTTLALYYKDVVLPLMTKLRVSIDKLEGIVSTDAWPIPTYGDLLFRI